LFNEWNLTAQVNNVFNKKYVLNGAAYPYIYNNSVVNDNYYYPAATINFMFAINIRL